MCLHYLVKLIARVLSPPPLGDYAGFRLVVKFCATLILAVALVSFRSGIWWYGVFERPLRAHWKARSGHSISVN